MKNLVITALLAGVPFACTAGTNLDQAMGCLTTGGDFFSPLIQRGLIQKKPYLVEDSINHFRVSKLGKTAGISAFGLPVEAVFGYVSGQIFFLRGPGTEPPDTYGVIVEATQSEADSRIYISGIGDAKTRVISKNRTAITCEGMP